MRPRVPESPRAPFAALAIHLVLALLAALLACGRAHAEEGHADPEKPHMLGPDARRFLAPSAFAYWAGAERTMDGELSLAQPRPFEALSLLPARDDHRSTTTYVRFARDQVRRGEAWNALELTSIHDLRGGPVLGVSFRGDVRDRTAVQGIATLTLPVSPRVILVPTIEAGARSDVAPELAAALEMRSDRRESRGYTLGVDVSRWTYDRTRALWKIGTVHRLTRAVALEERLAVGVWAGPRLAGDLALQWISSALQSVGDRVALYERVTLARGAALPVAPAPVDHSAFSIDVGIGARWSVSRAYGVVLQVDEGAQEGGYSRWGVELTLFGALF